MTSAPVGQLSDLALEAVKAWPRVAGPWTEDGLGTYSRRSIDGDLLLARSEGRSSSSSVRIFAGALRHGLFATEPSRAHADAELRRHGWVLFDTPLHTLLEQALTMLAQGVDTDDAKATCELLATTRVALAELEGSVAPLKARAERAEREFAAIAEQLIPGSTEGGLPPVGLVSRALLRWETDKQRAQSDNARLSAHVGQMRQNAAALGTSIAEMLFYALEQSSARTTLRRILDHVTTNTYNPEDAVVRRLASEELETPWPDATLGDLEALGRAVAVALAPRSMVAAAAWLADTAERIDQERKRLSPSPTTPEAPPAHATDPSRP